MSNWREDPAFTRWTFLEKIAGSELSRVVGVIPIAGYLILFNDGLSEALSFNKIAGVTTSTESTFLLSGIVKLRLTFFGSIFVFVANLLFRSCSPGVLNQSKSDLEFADRVIAGYSAREIQAIESEVFDQKWKFRTPLIVENERYDSYRLKQKPKLGGIREKRFMLEDHSEYIRSISREWWQGQMHSRKRARFVTLTSCMLGYLMLAIPSLDIAQAVIRDLL